MLICLHSYSYFNGKRHKILISHLTFSLFVDQCHIYPFYISKSDIHLLHWKLLNKKRIIIILKLKNCIEFGMLKKPLKRWEPWILSRYLSAELPLLVTTYLCFTLLFFTLFYCVSQWGLTGLMMTRFCLSSGFHIDISIGY